MLYATEHVCSSDVYLFEIEINMTFYMFRAWPCVWSAILGDTSTGWGLDLIMCNYVTQRCANTPAFNSSTSGCVVVDQFEVSRDRTLAARTLKDEGWKEAALYKNLYQGLESQVKVRDPAA